MRRRVKAVLILALLMAVPGSWAETLLVVRKTDDAVDFVDPGSGLRLATVELGHAPHEISVSPDGRLAAVSNYGTAERPGSTLSILDLEQARELRRIDLAPHSRPHGVDWYAANRLAVTAEGTGSLLVVDPLGGEVVDAITTGQDISHMVVVTADGSRAFVANIGSGTTTAIDLSTGERLAQLPTGKGSEGLAVTPNGQELWVGARSDGHLAVVDIERLAVIERLPLPGVPIRVQVTPDGRRVLVSCAGASEIVAFDTASHELTGRRRIELPQAPGADQRPFARLAPGSALPVGLALSADGRRVFAAATMADRIVELDTASLHIQRVIEVDGEPDGMALTRTMPVAPCHACTAMP